MTAVKVLKRVFLATVATALMVGWVAPATHADAITDDNVGAAVAAAKTPADHQALAAYFISKAEAAQAKVEMHRQMAANPALGGKAAESWKAHCNSLIATYQQQAKDYTALAKAQQEMAAPK